MGQLESAPHEKKQGTRKPLSLIAGGATRKKGESEGRKKKRGELLQTQAASGEGKAHLSERKEGAS